MRRGLREEAVSSAPHRAPKSWQRTCGRPDTARVSEVEKQRPASRKQAGPTRARREAPPGPAGVLRLQAQVGNRAIAGLGSLQRQAVPVTAPVVPVHTVVRSGSHGEEVRQAQRKLSRVQASVDPLTEDGMYGNLTQAAVQNFKAGHGIAPPNTELDLATWAQLDTAFAALPAPIRGTLSPGTDSQDVGFAQQKLNVVGATPRLIINGLYGPEMVAPVMLFEVLRMGRGPSGIIDAAMWTALDSAAAGGFNALEGSTGASVEQHTDSGVADPRGVQDAGTSLHPTVGVGGRLKGPAVNELQQKLNAAGAAPPLRVDGAFGTLTTAAVRAFQTSRVPPIAGTGIADATTWVALDTVAPGSTVGYIERQWHEETGGATFGKAGATASRYSWEIGADRMVVTVKVNFAGLTPPAAWFGHVGALWNRFKGVSAAPVRELPIDFQMIRGTGSDAQSVLVKSGTDRANAGNWFVGDTLAASTIPHEYGHLIGLQDEYQQRPGDYLRITGHEPPVGQTAAPVGQTPASIATALQTAMVARNDVAAQAAVAGMSSGAFAQRVVTAYATLPGATVPARLGVPAAPPAKAIPALPALPLTADLIKDLDKSLPNTLPRYETIQVLTYSSGSIMGDPSRAPDVHDHGAAPRHLTEFVGILGRALGGTWRAEQR